MILLFREVVSRVDELMGVKAVWGQSRAPVMCFGSRGNLEQTGRAYFSQARRTSERALSAPYLVTIGAGANVPAEISGRALELVRVTGTYGQTKAFVQDEALLRRLQQWPVASVLSEVYRIEGEPHLVNELGFQNLMILANSFDAVRRDHKLIAQLYAALSDRPVTRRWEILPPPGFVDRKKPFLSFSLYPTITDLNGREGKLRWEKSKKSERDPKLRNAALTANRAANKGRIVCEGCNISGDTAALFDVHHRLPLSAGDRITRIDDLAVLCPNCHRCCHALGEHRLKPIPVERLALSVADAYFTSK